jgi:transcriptional regulator with XRE-family HTH domain
LGAALVTLSEAAHAVLSRGQDSPSDAPALAAASEELARAIRAVLRKWKVLPFHSPYKGLAIQEARTLLDAVAGEIGSPNSEGEIVDLALELEDCDISRAEASLLVAEMIRAARGDGSVRLAAGRIGIGVGTLSPLENARGKLPNYETARKIDEALGTTISGVVEDVRQHCAALKDTYRSRRKAFGPGGARHQARLRNAIDAVRADPALAEVVFRMTELSHPARRTITRVVSELTEAFLAPSE